MEDVGRGKNQMFWLVKAIFIIKYTVTISNLRNLKLSTNWATTLDQMSLHPLTQNIHKLEQIMGIVDMICVSIVSTKPSSNVPKWINVFRYLACLQVIAYRLFLVWEPMVYYRQFDICLLFELHSAIKFMTW